MDSFAVLSDNTRRKIIELLARQGELTVKAICSHFSISPPAISQHLKVLKKAKMVTVSRQAQKRIYSLDQSGIGEIEDWLSDVKSQWNARLDSLDDYVLEMKKTNRK